MDARRRYVNQLMAGETIDQVFLVRDKDLRTTKAGGLYLQCTLCDKGGTIAARMWQISESIYNAVPVDGFLHVKGRTEEYRGNAPAHHRRLPALAGGEGGPGRLPARDQAGRRGHVGRAAGDPAAHQGQVRPPADQEVRGGPRAGGGVQAQPGGAAVAPRLHRRAAGAHAGRRPGGQGRCCRCTRRSTPTWCWRACSCTTSARRPNWPPGRA